MVIKSASFAVVSVLWLGLSAASAQDLDAVEFSSVKAADNLYMLHGAGGNIGLFLGPDGIFLIDDQFAPLHKKLIAKIEELSGDSLFDRARTFLINTHFHPDHTGGNELLGESGAVIVAHENVRNRLAGERSVPFFNSHNPPMSPDGLPVITFSRDITFHLNGDSVSVAHMGRAHTDGDAIVHFTRANVIHAGDIVFTQSYPFVDIDNGGSVPGVIQAVERLLVLADDQTAIIPGHGDLTDRAGLQRYHDMLVAILDRVSGMLQEGKSLEQIQAARLTQDYDDQFKGSVSGDAFVGSIYKELAEKQD